MMKPKKFAWMLGTRSRRIVRAGNRNETALPVMLTFFSTRRVLGRLVRP